jgi:hypothetical protein
MILASTLAILIGLTQANVNQQENGGPSNADAHATLPEVVPINRLFDRVQMHFTWLRFKFELWRLKRTIERNEKDLRKLQDLIHPRQIDFPRVPDYMLDRLPPGHRRV